MNSDKEEALIVLLFWAIIIVMIAFIFLWVGTVHAQEPSEPDFNPVTAPVFNESGVKVPPTPVQLGPEIINSTPVPPTPPPGQEPTPEVTPDFGGEPIPPIPMENAYVQNYCTVTRFSVRCLSG